MKDFGSTRFLLALLITILSFIALMMGKLDGTQYGILIATVYATLVTGKAIQQKIASNDEFPMNPNP